MDRSRASRFIVLTVSGLTAVSPCIAAQDKAPVTNDKAALERLARTYNEGFNAKDVDKIMSCYAPGSRLFVFDVVPPREYASWDAYKKDWQELFAAFPGPLTNTLSEQTFTVVGTVAYGHSLQTTEFTRKDGTKLKVVARTTDIYRKTGGKWLIVEEHNSVPVDLESLKPDVLSEP